MKIGNITRTTFRFLASALMAIWCVGVMTGCANRQDPINDLADLVADVQQHYDRYNDDDWTVANESLEGILEDIEAYHLEYTDEEWQRIGELKTKYSVLYSNYAVKQLKDRGNEALQQLMGGINALFNE